MAFTDDAPVHLLKKKPRKHRASFGWHSIGKQKCFFRSKWEYVYAVYLEWQRTMKVIKSWRHEPKTFWFLKIKRGVRSYKPDFGVKDATGKSYWVEVKGWMDSRSATKLKRMKKYYPKEDVRLVDKKWFINYSKGGLQ